MVRLQSRAGHGHLGPASHPGPPHCGDAADRPLRWPWHVRPGPKRR